MKKKKISTGLVSGFIAALALTACGGVTSNDEAIVTYTGYHGEQVNVLTNTIYNKYRQSSDGISKFYSAILESVIRYEFDASEKPVYRKTNTQIKTEAENNVTGAKQKAEENAKTNNTSYSTEWDAILSSYGVEDEEGLLEHFIYDIEKEELQEKYFSENKLALTKEYIGVDDEGKAVESKANGAFPYHIRHILINVGDGSSDYYKGTITTEQAKNIGNAIDYLTDSKLKPTFADAATRPFSGDEGSKSKGGDVGIMTPTTSFVDEFKLGIYAYDNVFAGHAENKAIRDGLGLNEEITLGRYNKTTRETTIEKTTVAEEIERIGVEQVPYDAFKKIGDNAETELVNGKKVNDGNANYYPRNIYWNNYLNFHNPFVITNQIINDDGTLSIDNSITDFTYWTDPVNEGGLRYLRSYNGVGKEQQVIIGVRGSYGIHLMIAQRSIYDFKEGGKESANVSLEEYYTTYVPGDDSYPKYGEVEKSTYVNYINTKEESEYSTRANEIKSAIKSFDSTYEYRIYEELVSSGKIHFNGEGEDNLGKAIEKYIASQRTSNKNSATKTLTSSWKGYLELINGQYQQRGYITGYTDGTHGHASGEEIKRVINVRCAIGFKTSGTDRENGDFAPGGLCYYEE